MRVVESTLEGDFIVVPDAVNVVPRPVVAIPPSSLQPVDDEMQVVVGGATVIYRAYDPDIAAGLGGFSVPYVTKLGDPYITKTGEPYVTKFGL